MPVARSEAYVQAAGPVVDLHVLAGVGHLEHLDPSSRPLDPVWASLAGA